LAMAGTGWRVSGVGGRGRFLYLAETRPREVRQGTLLLAQGRLVRGGISFGLVRDGVWAAQLAVAAPGSFVAIVRAPQDGEYEVALGNYVVGASLRYEVVIDRVGWIVDSARAAHGQERGVRCRTALARGYASARAG